MKKVLLLIIAAVMLAALPCTCLAASMPSWYPSDTSSFKDFHDTSAPRVVDTADLFTDEQETSLAERSSYLVSQYGMDFVIYTDVTCYGMSASDIARDFYIYNGYGCGDDFSGSIMFICMEPGNRQWYSAGTGSAERYYTPRNINDMDDAIEADMRSGDYYAAMMTYIDCLDILYGNKVSPGALTFIIIISAVLGAAAAAIILFVFYKGMNKIKLANEANLYVVAGSFNIRKSRDHYLYSTVTRVTHDTGSGKGGSSFSSSSSGGRSFSGGGRHF